MALSKENWWKGMLGLEIIKNALIPFLEEHFESWEWRFWDLRHILDLGAKRELKQTKVEGQFWNVYCNDCEPILKKLVFCHRQPNRLMWINNEDQTVTASAAYRLTKLFMSSGNADSRNLRDRDALAILEVCRNQKFLGFSETAFVLILFRNRLVHSSDNRITEDDLTGAFDEMKKLLGNDKLNTREECKTAVLKLNKLLKMPISFGTNDSNEIWKMAISIKEMALEKEGIVSPEVLKKLLEDTNILLLAEKNQRQNAELGLANSKRDLSTLQNQLEWSKNNEKCQEIRLESHKKFERDLQQYSTELQEYNRKLQEEVDELMCHTPSLAGRIAKGTATGTGVGFCGAGPVGAAAGGAAGGVVGALSYFWDKITGK